MTIPLSTQQRAFTIFGYSKKPTGMLKHELSERLGIEPKVIDFGTAGRFFFHATYGDVVESEQAIALKLGFTRTLTKSPLSTRQLLQQGTMTSQHINCDTFRGNAMVACFSKTEAQFVAFKNQVSLPQLYYWAHHDEIIGSDNLAILTSTLDDVEINEDLIPYHFMFRQAPGTLTYFRNIYRLFPGQFLRWCEGKIDIKITQDLRFSDNKFSFDRIDKNSLNTLYQEMKDIIEVYVRDVHQSGHHIGNLLSGGVDSSLLQLFLNDCTQIQKPVKTYSFAPYNTPSFEFEVEYAKHASELLNTDHTFINFTPHDYANMVVKSVEILGQPVLSDVEPCKLFLANALADQAKDIRYYLVAQGADTLFGLGITRKIKTLQSLGKIPGARFALSGVGTMLLPFSSRGKQLIKGANILAYDPDFLEAPVNTIAVYTNLDLVRRAFGDQTLRKALEYRRCWEEKYLNTPDYTEKVHIIDLLSDTYEIEVQSSQLFQANNKEQIYPFMDDDIIRLSLAFPPKIRYIQGFKVTKPVLKGILTQHGLSSLAHRPKGASVFTDDLYSWMQSGPLQELIQSIDLPDFVSRHDFEKLVKRPDHFLWSLLTFDIFKKKISGS